MKYSRHWLALAGLATLATLPLWAGSGPYTTADPPIAITDNTGALGTCQTITVPSVPGEDITGTVSVQITASHSWVGDLTFRLQPPVGTNLTLLNRPGRSGVGAGESDDFATATPITYDDAAASLTSAESIGLACTGVIGAGCGPNNYIPAPDATDTPIAGEGTNLAQFTGGQRNGVWTLCAGDSASGDTGTLTSWSLTFVNSTPVELLSFGVE